MEVSFLPLTLTVSIFAIPLIMLIQGLKHFVFTAATSFAVFACILLRFYVPGWILKAKSERGDPAATYELSRWIENHDEKIGAYLLWPISPDVLGGYEKLEESAKLNYPPAIYALGVRIKYGQHVPKPNDWDGPSGNVFPQPSKGQELINRAVELGYQPLIDEEYFYWQQYRK